MEPLKVEFWRRTVKVDEIVMEVDQPKSQYLPFISTTGRPPHYENGEQVYPGAYTRDFASVRITQTCSEFRKIPHGFTDLVVSIKVDKRGAHLEGMDIEYMIDGKRRILVTRWEMVACGTAVKFDDGCSSG